MINYIDKIIEISRSYLEESFSKERYKELLSKLSYLENISNEK